MTDARMTIVGNEPTIPVGLRAEAGASHIEVRLDAKRDTRIFATRNVQGHIHVTIGNASKATLILHPHAARRLAGDLTAVLDGKEFACG